MYGQDHFITDLRISIFSVSRNITKLYIEMENFDISVRALAYALQPLTKLTLQRFRKLLERVKICDF
jgi:hypothetical protein